jgi:hypothetical protein
MVCLVCQLAASRVSAELLLFYDFNSNANADIAVDASGRGIDGDIFDAEYSGPGGGRSGAADDRALDFLGYDDDAHIEIPSVADGAFDTITDNDAATVSVWLYGAEDGPVDGTVLWFAGTDPRQMLAHVPWSDQIIYFGTAGCDSCLFILEPDPTKYKGQWNHYAFVKGQERAAIYQNGELLIETFDRGAFDIITTARFGDIDPGVYGQAYSYAGLMDDIGVWDEALSDEAIAQLAAGINPVGGKPGDFNRDNVLDVLDIDDLTAQSAGGQNNAKYDLNGDALVNEGDVTVWVKDLFKTWVGDADLNREFNSSDLVTVLASGTYETAINAVWSTGDFNGDGRTNSSDLVVALADGGYEQGPPPPARAVPEPAACGLLLLGLATIAAKRRRRSPHS